MKLDALAVKHFYFISDVTSIPIHSVRSLPGSKSNRMYWNRVPSRTQSAHLYLTHLRGAANAMTNGDVARVVEHYRPCTSHPPSPDPRKRHDIRSKLLITQSAARAVLGLNVETPIACHAPIAFGVRHRIPQIALRVGLSASRIVKETMNKFSRNFRNG